MPPTYTTTAKRALRWLTGSNLISDIDAGFQALAEDVDTQLGSRAAVNISTTQARTNTAYGTLTTPDQVTGVVLPANGLIVVAYQATWIETVVSAARAAIFIGANQLKIADNNVGGGAVVQEAQISAAGAANIDKALATNGGGLFSPGNTTSLYNTGDTTTGQVLGVTNDGGECVIFAAAGTYTISVQFKASSGTVTVKNRKLWVGTRVF